MKAAERLYRASIRASPRGSSELCAVVVVVVLLRFCCHLTRGMFMFRIGSAHDDDGADTEVLTNFAVFLDETGDAEQRSEAGVLYRRIIQARSGKRTRCLRFVCLTP